MSEQRKDLRLPADSTTFIELESPGIAENSKGIVVTCKTLNISRGGLLVLLDQEIPVGAILQIGVDLPDAEDTLYMAGEVRWCKPVENASIEESGWQAGFQILNSADSNIDRWIGLVRSIESEEESD
ncbi:MAG: Tfp pilus assembly protein PilZ [Bacteroidia bacterium]|jgi:Tfp pilus assembly protein PilZ